MFRPQPLLGLPCKAVRWQGAHQKEAKKCFALDHYFSCLAPGRCGQHLLSAAHYEHNGTRGPSQIQNICFELAGSKTPAWRDVPLNTPPPRNLDKACG